MVKRALINIYDSNGIEDFIKKLQEKYGYEVFAVKNTYEKLKNLGFTIEKFEWQIDDFDIVIANFFPIEQYINKNTDETEILKNFDTEGLSILQKYVKRYADTLVITSSNQYEEAEEYIINGYVDANIRKKYAQKALLLLCSINSSFINITGGTEDFININTEKVQNLLYGENPQQKASLFENKTISYEIIANKELTYNNYLDINTATAIAAEFFDVNATVIVRHAMPCAVALGTTLEESYKKATDCDPVSAMGGVVAFSQKIDTNMAKILSSMFLEIIIAPDFDEDALESLKENNLIVIKINTPLKDYKNYLQKEVLQTPFGTLVQDIDNSELTKNTFKVVTKKKPTTEIVEDMVFAWKISKHTRSNSAVVVKNLGTVGIAQGETSRIEAIDIALNRACENSKDAVLATDGAITTKNGIYDAAQARIAGIIQPGMSNRDKEIVSVADKYELTMINTGIRQFKNK